MAETAMLRSKRSVSDFVATSVSLAPLAATAFMAAACAALSVFVVARRWAFIGEGISHSGFGGAGAAWLVMLVAPALVDKPWVVELSVVIFCLATAVAIGYLSRGDRVTSDAAIGIFLVASLAFGFLAQHIYRHVRQAEPYGFSDYLFGTTGGLEPRMATAAVAVSLLVLVVLAATWKQVLSYCFDPLLAEASGVPAALIHYLLRVLIALTIIIGMPITGSVLVTALLVLPGVTAAQLSQRLTTVVTISVGAAVASAAAGVVVQAAWPFIPTGPAIVLALFALFLLTYVAGRFRAPARA
jgi:ABC-type Mn2+/Zn2+ transport system permease subunit